MSESTGLRCALVGADSLLIECGELLLAKGHQIPVVAGGSPRVIEWAHTKGIPVVDADRPAGAWGSDLAAHRFDWLLAITHLAILPDEVVEQAEVGAINFHDGPLPRYAGLNTPAWALLNGDDTYGISWHLITSGVDEGDLVSARSFDIAPGETSLSLNTRNFEAAIETFEGLVDDLASGTLRPEPQDPSAPRTTYRRSDRPEAMAVLDWRRPAAELERTVRALTFGPYPNPLGFAKVLIGDRVVLVTEAEVVEPDAEAAAATPGSIVSVQHDRLVVASGDGLLAITSVTTPTGAPVALEELGLEAEQALPVLDDTERGILTELGQALAKGERRHLDALGHLVPVELPWARTPGATHTARFTTAPLVLPEGADQADQVAAAFAIALARFSGKDRFHLALVHPRRPATGPAADLVAHSVPVDISVAGDDSLGATADRLGADFEAARSGAPMLWELIARQPDLVTVPELAAGRLLPLAVRIQDERGPGGVDPAAGVVVELRAGPGTAELCYDESLVDRHDIELLASSIQAVLRGMVDGPGTAVGRVDLLGPELRTQVLEGWNRTEQSVPARCIHELFQDQADRTPHERAVVFEDQALTYAELDTRANQLAHHLIELGVGPDQLVGVHVTRGLDLLVSVVAVHKAGGAYVPLDPVYPEDRLRHMIRDSGCRVILTEEAVAASLPERDDPDLAVVAVDVDRMLFESQPTTRPAVDVGPENLAYCIYTSGSTGLPKGVLVEHRNAVNFFVGMDERIPHETPATWFAVTSLSFDISVLELLYTITRGFTVVIYMDRDRAADDDTAPAFVEQHATKPMGFSLFYFSGDAAEGNGSGKYRLLLDGARFADQHGFEAVWTPERHFHAFGGLYPQPAITGAAVAAITENVAIRAGSVVMPLHHPIRVAEAWSIVDNLSDGRVGVSVASGWQPNDFVLMPQNYSRAKDLMFEGIEQVKQLWRGESVTFPGATEAPVTVTTLPRPVQPELPVWVTSAGNPETYIQAGRIGANVLTHLLGQSVEQLAPKIEAYRKARAEAGFDPDEGRVSLMLHTFVGEDDDTVRELVREPLKEYLGTSFSLLKEYAWSFPAFQRPEGETADAGLVDEDFKNLSEEDLDAVLEFAFLRYYESSGLFGTPDRCRETVDTLKGIGVDEIACLIDFGVDTDTVLASLPVLDTIRQQSNVAVPTTATSLPGDGAATVTTPGAALDQSVPAQLTRHGVTHLQCTPSMARMWSMQDDTREALAAVENVFIGGEAFPVALGRDLLAAAKGRVTNMYGPTETTIWSTTWPLAGDLADIPIGTPIANTRVYVLDANREPLPPGVAGDLWIGGAGVVRGYHERAELTAERFVADPFLGGDHRMYFTGDLARWRPDGEGGALLEFLGRVDHQVKIRGYRIELGEIEAQLGRFPGVLECVAVVREDTPGDQQLVGYVSPSGGAEIDAAAVKEHLRATLPEVMVPGQIAVLEHLPHTPNGKIDRNALPSLAEVLGARSRSAAPVEAGSDLEREVLGVWEETLGTSGIGVNDNFFDIGGHSLLAVRMHRRLKDVLDRAFPLTDVYRYPTIRTFAESLTSNGAQAAIDSSKDRAARRRASLDRRRRR